MLDWFLQVDENVLRFVQENLSSDTIQNILVTVTHLGDYGIVWIIPGISLMFIKEYRREGLQLLICLAACGIINSLIIKNIVDRTRPFDMLHGVEVLINKPRDYSFPSGHTATSFGAAYALNKTFGKRVGVPAYALATVIGLSRVGVGVHYPSDVVVGAAIGTIVSALTIKGMKRFWKKQDEKDKRIKE